MPQQNQPFKVESTDGGKRYWTRIKAHEAKNWDGSCAGWRQGTPDGNRDVIEVRFVPADIELPVRYTNYW
jgi:hypothetical protein